MICITCGGCNRTGPHRASFQDAMQAAEEQGFQGVIVKGPFGSTGDVYCPDCVARYKP